MEDVMRDKLFDQGMKVRRKVLGAEYVDKQFRNIDEFTLPFQELATKTAWALVWARPGLSLKARSMINIAMLVAIGKADEIELHVAAAQRNGVSKDEIREILMQTAVYCGFPAALNGFRSARKFFEAHSEAKPEKTTPRVRRRKR
jgi:4-carboxymuconolactone decarboxylase